MFSFSSDRRSLRGFTLVELIVTIAIVAILAAIAAPSFQTLIANQQQQSAARDLVRSVAEGRSLAVLQRRNVELWAAYPTGTEWNGVVLGSPTTGSGAPANTMVSDLTTLKNKNASWYLVISGSIATLGQSGSTSTIANTYPLIISVSRNVDVKSNLTTDIQALRFLSNGTLVQVKGSSSDTTNSLPIPAAGVVFTICPKSSVGSGQKNGSTVTVTTIGVARVAGAAVC